MAATCFCATNSTRITTIRFQPAPHLKQRNYIYIYINIYNRMAYCYILLYFGPFSRDAVIMIKNTIAKKKKKKCIICVRWRQRWRLSRRGGSYFAMCVGERTRRRSRSHAAAIRPSKQSFQRFVVQLLQFVYRAIGISHHVWYIRLYKNGDYNYLQWYNWIIRANSIYNAVRIKTYCKYRILVCYYITIIIW